MIFLPSITSLAGSDFWVGHWSELVLRCVGLASLSSGWSAGRARTISRCGSPPTGARLSSQSRWRLLLWRVPVFGSLAFMALCPLVLLSSSDKLILNGVNLTLFFHFLNGFLMQLSWVELHFAVSLYLDILPLWSPFMQAQKMFPPFLLE